MNWVAPIKDYETLENFKKVLKDIDYKYYIMFELGIGTGLQLQDILTFKNKDVRGKSEITVKIGAKNIENTFTVPEELQKIITDYTEGKDPDAYLILGHKPQNRPVCREQAYRVLRAAGHKIGLSSIGAQTMRKTFAWNYYKKTGDIYHLQHLFNHASPSITYRFIGEKPNMEVVLKKMTPQENARSRYMLYLNGSGKKRLTDIIDTLTSIKEDFDNPANNDAFYGTVECLLDELDALITNYKETRESILRNLYYIRMSLATFYVPSACCFSNIFPLVRVCIHSGTFFM